MENTKFDKLFELLESVFAFVREQACKQFTDIAATSDNVEVVLDRVYDYAARSKWETRSAAAKAVSFITQKLLKSNNSDSVESPTNLCLQKFFFRDFSFDILLVLRQRELVANEGHHYESTARACGEISRAEVDREFGLNAKLLSVTSSDYIKDEDLIEQGESSSTKTIL